jgi:hypothetical protein
MDCFCDGIILFHQACAASAPALTKGVRRQVVNRGTKRLRGNPRGNCDTLVGTLSGRTYIDNYFP